MKNYRNFFRHTIFQSTYAMRSTSTFPCIMTMITNFMIVFIFQIFIFKFINLIFFFLKLIIFIACSLKNSQNFFIQSLPLYISCLFSMLLKEDIVDTEKPDGICYLTFVVDEFSGLFLHPSIFSIIHSKSA